MATTAGTQPPSQMPPTPPVVPLPPASQPDVKAPRQRRDQRPPQLVPGTARWSVVIGAASPVSPVVTDRQVFAVIPPATVTAYQIDSGLEVWKIELAGARSLAVYEGRLFVATAESMHALDAQTGAEVWRQPAGSLTAPPLVREGWIVTATEAEVTARRASDGTVVWQQPHGPLQLQPTIEGDTLYLPLADSRVRAVELTGGALKWERQLGGTPSEIAALANRVYVGSEDKFFYCLNAERGETEWRHRVGAAIVGRPAIDPDRVYFAAMDNQVRGLDRVNGALKWQAGLPFRPYAGPLLFGTALVVPGAVSELQTFDAATGKPGRPIDFGAPLASAPDLRLPDTGPIAVAITGGLSGDWKLTVWEQSMTIPVAPLSVLPGTPVALPQPPPPGGVAP